MSTRGFSLMELLIVMAIVAILASLAGPVAFSVQRSAAMTAAGQSLGNNLSLARLQAISHNQDVEFRFYLYADSGGPTRIHAFQAFDYNVSGTVSPLTKMIRLPGSIIMDSGATLSTVAQASRLKNWTASDPQPALPSIGTNYQAYVFRFRADGETDLTPFPPPLWFLTLHAQSDGDAMTAPPKNYITMALDPVNGHFVIYRP